MPSQTRIYKVANQQNVVRLVEAISATAALRHVVNPDWTVDVPNAKEVAALMKDGKSVEVAKDLRVAGEAA